MKLIFYFLLLFTLYSCGTNPYRASEKSQKTQFLTPLVSFLHVFKAVPKKDRLFSCRLGESEEG